MQLETERQVWLVTLAVTAIYCCVAAAANIAFQTPTDSQNELFSYLGLTIVITGPVTHFMARKMRENALLSAQLQRLVDRDRLTDVATRDYFFTRMQQDPDLQGVALMVDIDHFKAVNDTHGHYAGDAVIKAVAQVLDENIGPDDIVCRFGGEEFVVFLNDLKQLDGIDAAERLRILIGETTVPVGDDLLSVTVSVGGALKRGLKGIDAAIKDADAALYRAKNAGRNQTFFAMQNTPNP